MAPSTARASFERHMLRRYELITLLPLDLRQGEIETAVDRLRNAHWCHLSFSPREVPSRALLSSPGRAPCVLTCMRNRSLAAGRQQIKRCHTTGRSCTVATWGLRSTAKRVLGAQDGGRCGRHSRGGGLFVRHAVSTRVPVFGSWERAAGERTASDRPYGFALTQDELTVASGSGGSLAAALASVHWRRRWLQHLLGRLTTHTPAPSFWQRTAARLHKLSERSSSHDGTSLPLAWNDTKPQLRGERVSRNARRDHRAPLVLQASAHASARCPRSAIAAHMSLPDGVCETDTAWMPPRIAGFDVVKLCSSARPLEMPSARAPRAGAIECVWQPIVRSPIAELDPLRPSDHEFGLEHCTT